MRVSRKAKACRTSDVCRCLAARAGFGDGAREPRAKNSSTMTRSPWSPRRRTPRGLCPWKIDLFYDLMLNQFTQPGEPAGPRAKNINTIDEVPDSSWFTNRILARPLSIEEAVRGPPPATDRRPENGR